MKGKSYLYAGGLALAVAAALGLSVSVTQADPKKTLKVPALQFDPSFPKPLKTPAKKQIAGNSNQIPIRNSLLTLVLLY